MEWYIHKTFCHDYFIIDSCKKNFLNREGEVICSPQYFQSKESAEKAIQNYEETMKTLDWSQPLQTNENPPQKARLICSDRKSKITNFTHVVLVDYNDTQEERFVFCDINGKTNFSSCSIVNIPSPSKVPYDREDWERLSRVRKNNNKETSYPVGIVRSTEVVINGYGYTFDVAATIFVTMDGQELYK